MLNFLFGLRGSIDRLPYFIGVTACQLVMALFVGLLTAAATHPPLNPLWLVAFGLGILVCAWISFALTWKRLHDFEMHGAWALLMFVPVVGVGMYLIFSVLKGDIADPPFHAPPPGEGGAE